MHRRRSRPALLVTLAVLALCAGLGLGRVEATEEPADDADDGTITTTLYPGWNMVGWVGPETLASELFHELPELGRIFAWDGEEQRYQRLTLASGSVGDEHLLVRGDGLWLYIGGTSLVEWTREASEDSVLLDLHAGRNLVAWAGRDGTPIEEATVRFGEALVSAWRWDAGAQEYRLFAPTAGLDQVQELNHGDALLVELSSGGRWWQSGAAPPPVVFLGEFTDERQAEIGGWADSAQAVYAERWAVQAPMTTYVGDLESITPTYRQIRGGDPPNRFCGGYRNKIFFLWGCIHEAAVAHDYFHAIQDHLAGLAYYSVPRWLIEGTAEYAEAVHAALKSPERTVLDHLDAEERRIAAQLGHYPVPTLPEISAFTDFHAQPTGYRIGFAAARWLVDYSSEESMIAFFRAIAGDAGWEDAFESTFAIAVDDFYEEFDAYLAELAPPLPHLTDESDEPALVFMGAVAPATEEAVRKEFDRVRTFFGEQLGAGPLEYTIFAAFEPESVAAAHLRAFGEEPPDEFCDRSSNAFVVVVINLGCHTDEPRKLDAMHFGNVRRTLAPSESLPRMPPGFLLHGPFWLDASAATYVTYMYRSAAGLEGAEEIRDRAVASIIPIATPLSGVAARPELGQDYRGATGLGFLALEFLAEWAGDEALFDYYRRLPDSASWDEAFEGAFGIAVDDFYEAFEEHRARVVPRLPHLADDVDAPVLVFVGELPAATRTAVREDFEGALAFFRDRLGEASGDYTLYIGADAASLRDVFKQIDGRESTHASYCSAPRGPVVLISLQCTPDFAWLHSLYVLRGLAAPGVTPAGYPSQGPAWITEGTHPYVAELYRAARDSGEFGGVRSAQARLAAQTRLPLSSMATTEAFRSETRAVGRALGFLAVDWLVERAGERALFDYYRRLADSPSWEDAFEAAFGIAVDDFYEQFEAYRAEVAPPNEDADSS